MEAGGLERESGLSVVGILRQADYNRQAIKEKVATLWEVLGFPAVRSCRVVLKPNLVSGKRVDGVACTHGQFIAGVAEYLLDHGAVVAVGDSPAFGSARGVMKSVGIADALRGLPVEILNFDHGVEKRLACGVKVTVARVALQSDLLISLPKCKAHCQLLVSLAVKNYFGTVLGWRKPWLHMRFGDLEEQFAAVLVDLLALFPESVTFLDGIVALHRDGPINGEAIGLGVMAASSDPVALDTAMLQVLGVEPQKSLLWQECQRRGMTGADPANIVYPLLNPAASEVTGFETPGVMRPVSFHPKRLVAGGLKRLYARLRRG